MPRPCPPSDPVSEPDPGAGPGARSDGALGRRALLGGALTAVGALALAACSPGGAGDDPGPGHETSDADPARTSSSTPGDEDGEDRAIVARARRELSLAHAVTQRQAKTAAPSLRGPLAAFGALHAHHATALGGLVPVPRRDLTRIGAATTEGLVSTERRLQDQLVDLAVGASSGALAGRLASMAAAVAQRVSLL